MNLIGYTGVRGIPGNHLVGGGHPNVDATISNVLQ